MSLLNNLLTKVAANRICTSIGIKLVPSPEIILLAKSAGYDSVFIDLEHSTLSLSTASSLCISSLSSGITPFVRVPHQAGNGFVQRVLDNGAMGVIFPHIQNVEEAQAAVQISKYPPLGKRSLTANLPHHQCQTIPSKEVIEDVNTAGSTVFLMIETAQCLQDIDAIAAQAGVDVLLVGANDLGIEIGALGDWDGPVFRGALEKVAAACNKNGKIMGIAGLYHRPDIMQWAIHTLGVRYVLGGLDLGMIGTAMGTNCENLRILDVTK